LRDFAGLPWGSLDAYGEAALIFKGEGMMSVDLSGNMPAESSVPLQANLETPFFPIQLNCNLDAYGANPTLNVSMLLKTGQNDSLPVPFFWSHTNDTNYQSIPLMLSIGVSGALELQTPPVGSAVSSVKIATSANPSWSVIFNFGSLLVVDSAEPMTAALNAMYTSGDEVPVSSVSLSATGEAIVHAAGHSVTKPYNGTLDGIKGSVKSVMGSETEIMSLNVILRDANQAVSHLSLSNF